MSAGGITLTFGEDLGALLRPFGEAVFSAPGGPLAPLWTVVPTMSLRQWLDQELSRVDSSGAGGITANLRSIFPKDLVLEVERMALGEEWRDWGTEATSLRILGALGLSSFDEARRRAEAIDEVVRWRPHLLEPENRALLPAAVLEAMDAIDIFGSGPQVQRSEVLHRLRSGSVTGLPGQIAIFGLPNVPGGPRFLELVEALSSTVAVTAFLPVPSIAVVQAMAERDEGPIEAVASSSWRREADEATELWLGLDADHTFLDGRSEQPTSRLGRLQRHLADGEELEPLDEDRSIRLLGGFGDSRQVEQLRDALFEVIAEGVEPHEILVVSPRPTSFAAALERHWSYQPWDAEGGPRLPNELIEVAPDRLRNRLGASLALLRLVGNYATGDQVADLLGFPAVARTLRIDFDQAQELARRADEGKLIFGVSAEQRARFDVYPTDGGSDFPSDMGTWERVSDAVAVATLYPPKVADRTSVSTAPLDPVGEPGDLALFGSLQPVLRIIEEADPLRPPIGSTAPAERRSLAAWLAQLEVWMESVAAPDGEDDSFERLVLRLEASLAGDEGLAALTLTFEQFLELWGSMAQARQYSRIFGRGGIVIAGLEAFAYAPFKVVCILGLDEEKLPSASLPSQVMSVLPSAAGARRPLGDPDARRTVLGGLLAAVLSATETLLVSWNAADEGTGSAADPAIALSELLDAVGRLRGEPAEDVLKGQFAQARRHGFAGDHHRPRYDTRLLHIEEPPPPSTTAESFVHTEEISLAALQQFFRDPVGRHLRQAENVLVPRDLEASAVRPSLEVDHLTKHRLREAYVEALMDLPEWGRLLDEVQDEATYHHGLSLLSAAGAPIFDELCRSEELTGDVPALFWRDPKLRAQLDLYAFNLAFDLADHEVVTSAEAPELQAIDLGDLGRVTLLSAHSSASERFLPRRTISEMSPIRSVVHLRSKVGSGKAADAGNVVIRLIELLALRATNPDAECRVQTLFAPDNPAPQGRNMSAEAVPKGAYRLNPIFDLRATPESLPADVAVGHLAVLVDLYRRGLDEVLPIFRKTSEALALTGFASGASVKPTTQWSSRFGAPSESESLINRLLFPMTYRELTRETEVTSLARQIGQAGKGVSWWWGSMNNRMASAALRARHRGFEERERAVSEGIAQAEDDKARDKFGRTRSPLVEGGH